MQSKGKTFLKGALILAIANLVVKLIGAFFKVPLYNLLGKDGNGIFNVAYQIYTFMFIIATAGFPIAVSKMVAESIARGDERDAKRVFETAQILLGVIGIIGSAILYVFADKLAMILKNSDAAAGIRMISPSVFLVAMVSAYRGYFQGKQNMFPTAGSEVIEATAKLVVGIVIVMFVMGMTINPALDSSISIATGEVRSNAEKTVNAATGAILGVTAGTFLSLILMMIIYGFTKKKNSLMSGTMIRSRRTIMKELVLIAIPITIGASVSSLTSLVDLATIMNRLVINPGVFEPYAHLFAEGTEFAADALEQGWTGAVLLEKKANSLYGMYTGQAQTMFNLPLTMVVALSMSIVPAISAAIEKRNIGEARTMTESVLRITMLFAMPCAVGLSVLSKPILSLLYSDADAHLLLQKLAVAVVFVGIVSVSNAVLQSYGKVYYPVYNMLVGGVVKVAMNYVSIPVWGIDGAPLATIACYAVIAVLNIVCIIRVVKVKINIKDMIIKPLTAAAAMGIAAILVYGPLAEMLNFSRIATIVTIGVAVVVYGVCILLLKGLKREDIMNMPKGEKMVQILTKFKLL